MSVAPTNGSGPRWFSGPRRVLLVIGAVLLLVVGGLWAMSSRSGRLIRTDLGPGPVRGVRLTEFRPGEGDQTCPGLPADLPVVRLVEQVDVERMTLCLGPGRRADTYPLELFVLDAASPEAEQLLDGWAAAWSLPDRPLPWWQNPDEVACPAIAIVYPQSSITVAGVTMRPVPPSNWCQPLEPPLVALEQVAQAARPGP